MGLVKDLLKLLQGSIVRMNVLLVADVVSVVSVGRGINGAEPDCVNAESFEVIKLVIDAIQIADAVAVSICKASDPDLVV